MSTTVLEIKGERFAIIPEFEYRNLLTLAGLEPEDDLVDAEEFMARELGETLRKARESAGMTQAQLATKLKKSQGMVSAAELGKKEIGARYVASVLKACGLPDNWKPSESTSH